MQDTVAVLAKLYITTAPRLVLGAVYRHLKETMKMLWDENLLINTVHVTDVAR